MKQSTHFFNNVYVRTALIVLGTAILLILINKLVASRNSYSKEAIRHIKELIRQSTQAATIARQSSNPVIALTHVNFALAYANAAKDLTVSKEDIQRLCRIDIKELLVILKHEQTEYQKIIYNECPSLQPEGTYVMATGWI